MNWIEKQLQEFSEQEKVRLDYAKRLFVLENLLERISQVILKEKTASFVFRGSLILRNWVFPNRRLVNDLDLLGLIPYDINACEVLIRTSCAIPSDDNDIIFHLEKMEIQATWEHTEFPGCRIVLPYSFLDSNDEIQIDLSFWDTVYPNPFIMKYQNISKQQFLVPTVPYETALAWKVHGLFEFWDQGGNWTPKTLYDIHLMLTYLDINSDHFQESILIAFKERKTPLSTYNRILNQELGRSKGSRKSWKKFIRRYSITNVPENNIELIEKHRKFLDSFFIPFIEVV